ncbi:MAG: hypothetical protein HY290_26990 [Planctomycetia bacterium]|nr:hypothetical protein [Planctomycetia bacterium]
MSTQDVSTARRPPRRRAVLRLHDLSSNCAKLVHKMQQINFGYVEDLQIRNGEPDLDKPYTVRRKVKMTAARDGPRPKTFGSKNFVLKRKIIKLFDQLRQVGHGTISSLEIQHGLPFAIEWNETSPIPRNPR